MGTIAVRSLNEVILLSKQIFVTGHKSPDTDSICTSIAYAKLQELQGVNAIPVRAGEINKESAFALQYFKAVSYTHLTLPTILRSCRSRWSPYH